MEMGKKFRQSFYYWKFKDKDGKVQEGVVMPKDFDIPRKGKPSEVLVFKENRRAVIGVSVGLGYKDYSSKEEAIKDRDKEWLIRKEKFKKYIEQCNIEFERIKHKVENPNAI